MTENVIEKPVHDEVPRSPLAQVPMWLFQTAVVVAMAIVIAVSTYFVYQEAVADMEEERAELIAEDDEASAAEVELDFDIEDAYRFWAWGILFVVMAQVYYFGSRANLAFASIVQIGLIILLVVSFTLMTQRVERDVFRVGIFSLIIFTLVQVAFGNIDPQANFWKSMRGLLITAVIIGAVVGFSIWLTPYLINLGS
ncbi:MAG: hypothetical protein AAFV33_00265 [Chloroflexota bacterium]